MSRKKNPAHSVFQRLLNHARKNREDFNLLLIRYGMERFLYRLSISTYNESFILKGASLFLVWKGQNYRVTKDVDFLALERPELSRLREIFHQLCKNDTTQEDGISFLSETLKIEEIRENKEYDGIRVILSGMLGQARIPLQIDIGFGDVVTPGPELIEYPVLLNFPPPKLKAYPRYTLVAEKLEAMVYLGLANSRMKDFYDILLVSKLFSFNAKILMEAIINTFNRRHTKLPEGIPFALTPSFFEDSQKQVQWKAFISKAKPDFEINEFTAVIEDVKKFIIPVIEGITEEKHLDTSWEPAKGWIKLRK
ncbi:MAG: nucleotidyl transferase AbiEii/AbiGii toxin family protein [Acidobacteria bacterium]|nr:MAG: nucleotidyl transferase AbiEii/AbiGii toxin family protein [Acidobacteriota bacterium]